MKHAPVNSYGAKQAPTSSPRYDHKRGRDSYSRVMSDDAGWEYYGLRGMNSLLQRHQASSATDVSTQLQMGEE